MRHSNNHYTDLFGEQRDHDLERLEKHIETLAHVFTDAKMPSEYNVAISRALQENISTQRKNNLVILNRFPVQASRRAILIAVTILSIVLLTSTVFASIPLVNQALIWHDSRMQQVSHHQLGQIINIERDACGFSMIVQRIYADANDIVVAYTIKAPTTRTFIGGFSLQTATLSDLNGNKYPMIDGNGTANIDNETGNVMVFDAGGTTKHPQNLKLHLTVPTIVTSEKIENPSHMFASCETYQALKKDEVSQSLDYTKMRKVTIHGPFVSDFSIPFASGQELDLNQTVQSGGTTVELERVVITPIETRFYVKGVTQATDAVLITNGQTIDVSGSRSPRIGLVIYSLDATSLYNQHGQCKLIISSRPDLAKVTTGGAPDGGPWSFYFRVS